MHDETIGAVSLVVTKGIKQDIGNSWYKIKVDGAKNPTGVTNIFIVIPFFIGIFSKKRLLVLSITDSGDTKSIADVILVELTKAGLSSSKKLSQVYDGTSGMVGYREGVQRLLQERENRKIPYVHCLSHQLHLVVVHAISVKQAINNFFARLW